MSIGLSIRLLDSNDRNGYYSLRLHRLETERRWGDLFNDFCNTSPFHRIQGA